MNTRIMQLCVSSVIVLTVIISSVHIPVMPNWRSKPELLIRPSIVEKVEKNDEDHRYEEAATEYSKKKLQLVFHVGPRKTATTTIQTDLTTLQDKSILEQDGWEYAGRLCHPFHPNNNVDGRMVNGCTSSRLHKLARNLLVECGGENVTGPSLCVRKQFLDELDKYHKKGLNVIMSDESWGKAQWSSPAHYSAIRAGIDEENWDVMIIAGYRYFFEWLPSDMFQDYRLDHATQKWHEIWPGQTGEGREIEFVFPTYYTHWYDDHVFTDWVVHCVNGTFPLLILDLHHKPETVVTNLLCNLLNMTHACAYSQALDAQGVETRMNLQSNALHAFYDIVAVKAAQRGLINTTRWTRPQVRTAMQQYHFNTLHELPSDFDLLCPNETQLSEHLQFSLDLESSVFGAAIREAATRSAFQQRIEEQFFCNVDAEAVLQKEAWKSFLKQYS